jgi:phosphoglycerate kinase
VIRSIENIQVSGKRVIVRVDFNVPMDSSGSITDDTRMVASLPTLRTIVGAGGVAVVMSHLGRPKGEPNLRYSLRPVAEHLATLIDVPVAFVPSCIGPEAEEATRNASAGSIIVLENLRFHAEEETNDEAFAASLARLGDVYCNDAFGTAHRAHASTAGIARHFSERCCGFLMRKELDYLGSALESPKPPLVAVLGGSKISGKIDVIKVLLGKCQAILIGGGMMFTFLKAKGLNVGNSLVEADRLDLAAELLAQAERSGVQLQLPIDAIVADKFANDARTAIVSIDDIPSDMMGLDIGPRTSELFASIIGNAGTVLWNGPMGVFEMPSFESGTRAVAAAMAHATEVGAVTVVGGGDSAAAIVQFGYHTGVTHVSTGGGASLEFLEGRVLPGVAALEVS